MRVRSDEFDPVTQTFTKPYCELVKLLILRNLMDDEAQMITSLHPPILEFPKSTAVMGLCSSSSEKVCGIQPGGSINAWLLRRYFL
jgi:hypothetical protein